MAVFVNKKDRKMAVFLALKQQDAPIDLPGLLEQLGPDYAERTVRRWLADMAEQGIVEKTGQKRGTRYRVIQRPPTSARTSELQVTYPKSSVRQTFEVRQDVAAYGFQGMEAIIYVRQPLFQRKPVSYNPEWLAQYTPNQTVYLPTVDRDELERAGRRSIDHEPAGTYARRIYNRLLIDLSYNSSRLEGNTYSLIDTERLIVQGVGVEGKLDQEKAMILNHKEAIRHLVDSADTIHIDYNEICTLHFLLAEGLIPAQYAGYMRDHGVRIGGSTYIPWESPTRLEKQLRLICQKAAHIQNPYEQSLFLLAHVAYLQAFTDVNKRTSRLCANIPLIQNNLVPLSFNEVKKDDYASSMIAVYELNDIRPLAALYRNSYLRTCEQYDSTAEAAGFDEIRVRYRRQRRELIGHIVTHCLTGDGMNNYIQFQVQQLIPNEHRANFLEDVQEDLNNIAPQRIAGMGVTVGQLQAWLKAIRR